MLGRWKIFWSSGYFTSIDGIQFQGFKRIESQRSRGMTVVVNQNNCLNSWKSSWVHWLNDWAYIGTNESKGWNTGQRRSPSQLNLHVPKIVGSLPHNCTSCFHRGRCERFCNLSSASSNLAQSALRRKHPTMDSPNLPVKTQRRR